MSDTQQPLDVLAESLQSLNDAMKELLNFQRKQLSALRDIKEELNNIKRNLNK